VTAVLWIKGTAIAFVKSICASFDKKLQSSKSRLLPEKTLQLFCVNCKVTLIHYKKAVAFKCNRSIYCF